MTEETARTASFKEKLQCPWTSVTIKARLSDESWAKLGLSGFLRNSAARITGPSRVGRSRPLETAKVSGRGLAGLRALNKIAGGWVTVLQAFQAAGLGGRAWTKTAVSLSSGLMDAKPFGGSNHFTTPVAITAFQDLSAGRINGRMSGTKMLVCAQQFRFRRLSKAAPVLQLSKDHGCR